jgi:hypothetical protein
MPEGRTVDAGMHVLAELDSRDSAFNPTRGFAAAIDYMQSDRSMGADAEPLEQRSRTTCRSAAVVARDTFGAAAGKGPRARLGPGPRGF